MPGLLNLLRLVELLTKDFRFFFQNIISPQNKEEMSLYQLMYLRSTLLPSKACDPGGQILLGRTQVLEAFYLRYRNIILDSK